MDDNVIHHVANSISAYALLTPFYGRKTAENKTYLVNNRKMGCSFVLWLGNRLVTLRLGALSHHILVCGAAISWSRLL